MDRSAPQLQPLECKVADTTFEWNSQATDKVARKGLPQRKHHSTPAFLTGGSLGGSLVWLGMTILQRPGKQTSFVNGNRRRRPKGKLEFVAYILPFPSVPHRCKRCFTLSLAAPCGLTDAAARALPRATLPRPAAFPGPCHTTPPSPPLWAASPLHRPFSFQILPALLQAGACRATTPTLAGNRP